MRCRANLRYEMLAAYVRESVVGVEKLAVLELDPRSPLRPILSKARFYARSFYRPGIARGCKRHDGAEAQDITNLTYEDNTIDLIVSSDVLEHVEDADAAFRESYRVLKPGGRHLFTVPTQQKTVRLAVTEHGVLRHMAPPEYHSDPLDPKGILTYWHYGPDLPERFAGSGLRFRVVAGPEGLQQRQIWEARKPLF